MGQRDNIAITPEGWAAATEKMRAERAAVPQLAAMDKAAQLTKAELAELEAAKAKVDEAQAAVDAAGAVLARSRAAMEPTSDTKQPFAFFLKTPRQHKAAAAAEPGLKADWEEARTHLQNATRRLNATVRVIDLARGERRRAAKFAHAPKSEPPTSRADACQKLARKQAA